jgi:predicted transcriptional regulator
MLAWFISGFLLEYQIINNLHNSGSSKLEFYSITVVEKPIPKGTTYDRNSKGTKL